MHPSGPRVFCWIIFIPSHPCLEPEPAALPQVRPCPFTLLKKDQRNAGRPWIVVVGDEAGKVWVLKPKRKKGWSYDINVIFDINEYYGPNTTQTNLLDKPLITVSTIGSVTTRYDRSGKDGMTEIYIPVFEGQEIRVFSFRKSEDAEVSGFKCPEDIKLDCPAAGGVGGGVSGIWDCDTWELGEAAEEE